MNNITDEIKSHEALIKLLEANGPKIYQVLGIATKQEIDGHISNLYNTNKRLRALLKNKGTQTSIM